LLSFVAVGVAGVAMLCYGHTVKLPDVETLRDPIGHGLRDAMTSLNPTKNDPSRVVEILSLVATRGRFFCVASQCNTHHCSRPKG
jgi:hypothetical protein